MRRHGEHQRIENYDIKIWEATARRRAGEMAEHTKDPQEERGTTVQQKNPPANRATRGRADHQCDPALEGVTRESDDEINMREDTVEDAEGGNDNAQLRLSRGTTARAATKAARGNETAQSDLEGAKWMESNNRGVSTRRTLENKNTTEKRDDERRDTEEALGRRSQLDYDYYRETTQEESN
jgi:hypothetical protein